MDIGVDLDVLIQAALIFLAFELLAGIVFFIIRWRMGGTGIGQKPLLETFKGLLERLMLISGFCLGVPQVLIFFGAIKIGARLTAEGDTDAGKNYFIVGNLVSVLFVFAAYALIGPLL